jgi:Uma2 family endonuclease
MVATLISTVQQQSTMTITWESLPEDFILEEEPVENTAQPLIAGALRESLELIGYIEPTMLIASNLGICATMNGNLVIKAPDWFYVKTVLPLPDATDRRSYTPNLEGEIPQVVMEFLSETDGKEYSAKRAFPPGKWFFYEQILQVPTYVIFDSADGVLEVHRRSQGQYELQPTDENNRYWIADMGLFLGVWQGEKEGRKGYWLRWWDQVGNLLPWAVELLEKERQRTQQEQQRAEQEQQRAERERQRAERMAEQLRALGIFPSD